MLILHSSDWHLGRKFGPVSLHDAQSAFADWFVGTAIDRRVDLVVIAGDLYDRAVPPTESIALLRTTLRALCDARIPVVLIAGNHDSAERVAAYDGLVDAAGVHVRGGYDRPGEVLALAFADGPLDVVALPYLDPDLAPPSWDDEGDEPSPTVDGTTPPRRRRRSHQWALEQALARSAPHRTGCRSLAVAHGFVTASGADPQVSDSERHLSVGGTDAVDVSVFDGFSYVALGHLHTPQAIGGRDAVRYSGTPLAYSFSETTPKSVVLVDLGRDGTAEVELLAVPGSVGKGVCTVTGTIDQLVHSPDPGATGCFVRAVLTDATPVLDAKARLQVVYPDVVEIEQRPERSDRGSTGPVTQTVAERRALSARETAVAYWCDLFGEPPSDAEAALMADALHEASDA